METTKKILLKIFLAAIFSGCTTLPKPDFNPGKEHLKVVSYNVNWGCPYPNRVVAYLKKSSADIICLQETHQEWQKVLTKPLANLYPHMTFKNFRGAGGIAIISKYKLENVRLIEPKRGWFPALIADINTPIGKIQFVNVHLRPPLANDGSVSLCAWLNSSNIHKEELSQFLQEIQDNQAVVVIGDFNENENDAAIAELLGNGYTDALSLYDTSSITWKWKWRFGITLDDRYDHIIFNKQLACTGAKVTYTAASDHMPVLAVITKK